jgi:elongation factor Ts
MTTPITAAQVNELRQRTSRPMMECKKALTQADGDMAKAEKILRETGHVAKGDRTTGEGRIAVAVDPARQFGAMIEVLCESAPVAKSELFVALADDLARQVAIEGAKTPEQLLAQKLIGDPSKTVQQRIADVVNVIREAMKPGRMVRLQGHLGHYVHHDGSIGVLLQVEGNNPPPQVLRDVCMHIAATKPIAARREDVPAEVVEKEKEIARAQIANDPKNANKPANILDKIAEGKLKTFFAENVLVDQPFVKDASKTVGQLLQSAGLKVVRFVRYKVGEAQ